MYKSKKIESLSGIPLYCHWWDYRYPLVYMAILFSLGQNTLWDTILSWLEHSAVLTEASVDLFPFHWHHDTWYKSQPFFLPTITQYCMWLNTIVFKNHSGTACTVWISQLELHRLRPKSILPFTSLGSRQTGFLQKEYSDQLKGEKGYSPEYSDSFLALLTFLILLVLHIRQLFYH